MLYVTTRGKNDVYTPARTLNLERGTDGGLFVPFRMPQMEQQEIKALPEKKASQVMADVINLFCASNLTDWDVELAFGRQFVNFHDMGYKLKCAELWHNTRGRFSAGVDYIGNRIYPDGDMIGSPTNWVQVVVRIAMFFGLYTQLRQNNELAYGDSFHVAVASGDFVAPMAAWYAREMGLPIGNIIVGCNENSAPWDLIHRGEMDTNATLIDTDSPDNDYVIPPNLERLVSGSCGMEEAMNFCWSIAEKQVYMPDEETAAQIREGMYASVVSGVRVTTMLPGLYRSQNYILDPNACLAYGAVADYRARAAGSGMIVIISECSPLSAMETVANAMRISTDELKRRVSAM